MQEISLEDPRLHYAGRVPKHDRTLFYWPGNALRFLSDSSQAIVQIWNEGQNYFDLIVTDRFGRVLQMQTVCLRLGVNQFPIVSLSVDGPFEYQIFRRTEGLFGPTRIMSLKLDAQAQLFDLKASHLKIEFYGDSITVGAFSDELDEFDQWDDSITHNHRHSYAALASHSLGADFRSIAYSGMGLIQSWNQQASLLELWDRETPQKEAKSWNFSRWQADVIVVNIGQNDYVLGVREHFVEAYQILIKKLRIAYPEAVILCTLGGMAAGQDQEFCNYLKKAVDHLRRDGIRNIELYFFQSNANLHPRFPVHQAMAAELKIVLRNLIDKRSI